MRCAGLLPLLTVACGVTPPDNPFETPPTFTLAVSPAVLEVVTGPDGAAPVTFTASVTFDDGSVATPDAVEWGVSNRSVGVIDAAGLFQPSLVTGGETWITAEVGGVVGRADVLVRYRESRTVGAVATEAFEGTPLPTQGHWLYPAADVNLPRNIPALRFEWTPEEGAVYRLAFTSPYTQLSIYTDVPWLEADAATWATIAGTNAGGDVDVVLSIALLDGTVLEEPARPLHVNRMDAEGSVIYWTTTTGLTGLIEVPWGEPAVPYLTATETGRCIGCHVLSNDGKLAFTYDGGNGGLGLKRMSDGSDVIGPPPGGSAPGTNWPAGNFKAFSPDGRFLLGSVAGTLRLYDADTGAVIRDIIADGKSTHVDWSPDDSQIVFVRTAGHVYDWEFKGATQLMAMPHLGDGRFGTPRVLHDAPEGWVAFYPAFSPDGNWIAFNQSTDNSNNDPDAELWVIDSGARRAAVRLDAANAVGELTNSWPRWAPLPDDDVLWLAFSSKRLYGTLTSGQPQIWVAGFDPARATEGQDPTWPAFWLAGQDVNTSNHQPFWVR